MTSIRRSGARLLMSLPLAGALFACDSQVESDYPGEPMATLRGSVAAGSALTAIPDVAAAVVWNKGDPRVIGERIDVSGEDFPSSFTLDLYAPPPPEAELKTMSAYCIEGERISSIAEPEDCEDGTVVPVDTGVGVWFGYLAAIDASLPDGEIERTDVYGVDVDHFLVYFDHEYMNDEPLPANPTPEQLAKKHMLTSIDYVGSTAPGYHLAKFNPKKKALLRKQRECEWEGLCVHWTDKPEYQSLRDWEFESCVAHFPENPTCDAVVEHLSEGEPAASTECREQYESLGHDCGFSTSEGYAIENPDDLDDPVEIQLGLSYFDASE